MKDWKLWEAEIDDNAQDSDYLRNQQCCTACGQYTGHLPGFWFIQDYDECPECRKVGKLPKWSEEVMLYNDDSKEERKECLKLLKELGI